LTCVLTAHIYAMTARNTTTSTSV